LEILPKRDVLKIRAKEIQPQRHRDHGELEPALPLRPRCSLCFCGSIPPKQIPGPSFERRCRRAGGGTSLNASSAPHYGSRPTDEALRRIMCMASMTDAPRLNAAPGGDGRLVSVIPRMRGGGTSLPAH
jgi:hypothetical protein